MPGIVEIIFENLGESWRIALDWKKSGMWRYWDALGCRIGPIFSNIFQFLPHNAPFQPTLKPPTIAEHYQTQKIRISPLDT